MPCAAHGRSPGCRYVPARKDEALRHPCCITPCLFAPRFKVLIDAQFIKVSVCCLFVCLLVCLSLCLFVCLPACLPVCLSGLACGQATGQKDHGCLACKNSHRSCYCYCFLVRNDCEVFLNEQSDSTVPRAEITSKSGLACGMGLEL